MKQARELETDERLERRTMTPKKELLERAPERPRMPAEDRRQQIIDVAVQLFSQKGFRGTTTKEIALAAEVNEAIIFRHFATKRELYAAIMDRKASAPRSEERRVGKECRL